MAVTKNLLVRAGADFSAITTQSKKASASMKSMGNAAASAGSMMKKAFGALGLVVSLRMIVSAAKDAAEAFQKQAEAETKLAQVMKNTMGASKAEIDAIKDLCSAQQELGIIGDDVTMAGAQQLASFTKQTDTLKKLLPVMDDLIAAQYGFEANQESAASVAKMLGKAMNGQTTSLAKLGFQFTDAQKKIMQYGSEEERAATLADVVSAHVGGMNAALANTPTGRMQQLKNTMSDIKESFGQAVTTIGTVFLPLLNRVASMLATIAAWANRVAQAIANVFGKKIKTSTAAVAAGAGGAASSFEDMEDAAKGAGSAAKEAAKSVLSFDILNKLSDNSSSGGGGSGTDADAGGGGGILDGFGEEEEETAETSEKLERALQRIKDLIASINFEPLQQAAARVREAFSALADVIGGALSWAFDNVLAPLAHWTIEDALPAALDALASGLNMITEACKALSPAFQYLFESIIKPVGQFVGHVLVQAFEGLKEAFDSITSVLTGEKSITGAFQTLSTKGRVMGTVLAVAAAAIIGPWGLAAAAIAAGVATIISHWDDVKEAIGTLKEKWKEDTDAIKAKFSEAKESVGADIENIKEYFAGIPEKWESVKTSLAEKWDAVKAKFTEGKEQLQTDIENIKAYFAGLSAKWEGIRAAIVEKWDAVKAKFTEGKEQLQADIENIKEFFAGLSQKWEEIRAAIAEKWDTMTQKFNNGRDKIKAAIDRIKSFFEDLKTKWNTIKDQISQKIDDLKQKWENFKLAFGSVKDAVVRFAQNLLSGVTAPFNSIISLVNSIASACQTAAAWVSSVLGAGGYADQFAERNMEAGGGMWNGIYASGGWPDVGEVFLAREAGPEMVGTIGGRTAVANNDDIVEAVARGVATAVAQVLNSGGGRQSGGSVTLNVNGKEFCRAIFNDMKSVNSEHGISLVNS
jgi:serine/threonine-protein kinase RIO1